MQGTETDPKQQPRSRMACYLDMIFEDSPDLCEPAGSDEAPETTAVATVMEEEEDAKPQATAEPMEHVEPETAAEPMKHVEPQAAIEVPEDIEPQTPPEVQDHSRVTTPRWQRKEEIAAPPPAKDAEAKRTIRPKLYKRKVKAIKRNGDSRQKVMMIAVPILAITLYVLLKHPVGVPGGATTHEMSPEPPAAALNANIEIDWRIPPVYDPDLRDPMQLTPPREKVRNEPIQIEEVTPRVEFLVTGILYSQEEPTAIVNTRVVREGQQLSGATVVKIKRDSVEFEMNGRRWRQTVHSQN